MTTTKPTATLRVASVFITTPFELIMTSGGFVIAREDVFYDRGNLHFAGIVLRSKKTAIFELKIASPYWLAITLSLRKLE